VAFRERDLLEGLRGRDPAAIREVVDQQGRRIFRAARGLGFSPSDAEDLAQEVLRNIINEESGGITIETIQRVVAEHYGLRVTDLKSKNNSRSISEPRQVAMYLCKSLTRGSLPEIGREFGGKHHTTVLHSINKISRLYEKDNFFHKLINNLISEIK